MRPGRFLTVVDAPRPVPDGGRSASERARRWSICLRTCQTVVDPPTFGRRVATADRPPSANRRRRWSIYAIGFVGFSGGAATVYPLGQTVAALPPRHAGGMSADRPLSGTFGGRSTTVRA